MKINVEDFDDYELQLIEEHLTKHVIGDGENIVTDGSCEWCNNYEDIE